ncbi:NAD(P)H-dependent oxidoreductase [Jiella sp. MQZ9-1]|uniref:NAD(P)H-dependent oxidoreductase n=1 Tax=Jiella flava TaxID=2816857 RepID=UPI001E426593|nr:NAD(P)H-dependent oxidoreductase [Jiella flava]
MSDIEDHRLRQSAIAGPVFVGFAGSWSQPSKTRTLVEEAASRAVKRFAGSSHVFDIGDLGDTFGVASRPQQSPALDRQLKAFLAADALIVASPVFKGSYTGLFKHFIDLIDPDRLRNKPVLLAATGGGHRHSLVVEHQLRPLFGFFECRTLATGIYAGPEDFADGRLVGAETSERLDRAVEQFADHLAAAATGSAHRIGR